MEATETRRLNQTVEATSAKFGLGGRLLRLEWGGEAGISRTLFSTAVNLALERFQSSELSW